MRDFLIFIPITVLYLVLKSTIFISIPIPDLPLIIVLFIAYNRASVEGVVLSFLLGYLEDAFTGGIFGSTSFALMVVFVSVYLLSQRVTFSTPFIRALAAGLFTLLKGLLIYIVLRIAHFDAPFLGSILIAAVVTGAFTPAIILLLGKFSGTADAHTP
jgi:rod shape-determining protein MreD